MAAADLPTDAAQMDREAIGLLTVSHFLIDFCQGVVPALLPFLVGDLHLTYAAATGLVFASSAASSVVQPLFGQAADRLAWRWMLPASLVLTGVGLAAGAVAPTYAILFVALAVSGLGVAAFHPDAARLVRLAAGRSRAGAMSIFAVGGSLGFATAPVLTAATATGIGRAGITLVLLPVIDDLLRELAFVLHATETVRNAMEQTDYSLPA